MIPKSIRTLCLIAIIAATPGLRAAAQSKPTSPLEQCAAFYRQLDHVAGSYTATIRIDSMKLNMTTEHDFVAQRPNRISLTTTKGAAAGDAICDGKQLYATMPMLNRYTLSPAPKSFETWRRSHAATSIPMPGMEFVVQLLSDRPMLRLLGDPAHVRQLADEAINQTTCHHFSAKQAGHEIELWIEAGPSPWVRRLRTHGAGPGGADAGATEIEMVIEFAKWSTDAPDADQFEIHPPGNFEKADSLFPRSSASASAGPSSRPAPSDKVGARVGELAPSFQLDLLGGGKLDLGQHLGKSVIVLDFWATWCHPCVMGLPIISEVTSSMNDHGVVFFAVNIAEDPKVIEKFMSKKSFNFPVALDTSARTAKLYGVGPIPHTVIIGRNGKIAHVHVGYSSELKSWLTGALEALTKGSGG